MGMASKVKPSGKSNLISGHLRKIATIRANI
jgi:hypothetical protein